MQARNRNLKDWYGMIQRREIKLPRFQRYEAWDRDRIASLIETVVRGLPLGITLVLEVNADDEKFVSRYLQTAPDDGERVLEHLLDGQQRLTALWRTFHNNYEWETYFVYLNAFDEYEMDEKRDDLTVFCRHRYVKKDGTKYPLWCDDPAKSLRRGFIPTHLLKPEDMQNEIDNWLEAATSPKEPEEGDWKELKKSYDFRQSVRDKIRDLRTVVSNYNLPHLSLPSSTEKSVALDVFINMNTNSKPLSQYDIIVAEVESVMGRSLHDLQDALLERHPATGCYSDLSNLILTTSALLQDALPNQRGAWDMDKPRMVENWEIMEAGLNKMVKFLRNEGIHDRRRLPTNAVLAVIAALYSCIPESGDKKGQDELLLKKYMWHAFFTDRYENAAATHAYADFTALKRIINGAIDKNGKKFSHANVPIFSDHDFVEADELLTVEWPKRATIRGRAVLAVACRLGALDFYTGERLAGDNIEHRHYHHIYPDALLKEAGINSFLALNCALINDKTNISIGKKDPLVYLKERYEWTSEDIVKERLHSHLIPVPELSNGGYEGCTDAVKMEKMRIDFEKFLQRRAELVIKAARALSEGHPLNASSIFCNQ